MPQQQEFVGNDRQKRGLSAVAAAELANDRAQKILGVAEQH
jgi:hypothetical protein